MKRPRTRIGRTRRRIEALVLAAGVIGVGLWAWSQLHTALFQKWGELALDRRMRSNPAGAPPSPQTPPAQTPPAKPQPVPTGELIGRLVIPRLHMRAVVREGAGEGTLDTALGHIPGTAFPGQPGNSGIAGHRDTLFRGLRNIATNDVIQFQTPAGTYNYKVESTGIVKPQKVSVLDPGRYPEMTLVTCYPFYYLGSAPDRFIVKARLMDAPAIPASMPAAAPRTPALVRTSGNEAHREARQGTPAAHPAPRVRPPLPSTRRVSFHVAGRYSREIAPGIRLGVARTDPARQRASVWMLVSPEHRIVSFNNQPAHMPVSIRARGGAAQPELTITRVTADSVTGYLQLASNDRPAPR